MVHHLEKPSGVGFDETKYREVARQPDLEDRCWWWDAAAKNLHVRVKVKAGGDCIVNVEF